MAGCLEFWRCVFCCQDEEYEEENLVESLITSVKSRFENEARNFNYYGSLSCNDERLPINSYTTSFGPHKTPPTSQSIVQNTTRIHNQSSNVNTSKFSTQIQKESNLNSSKFPTQVHQQSKSGSSNLSTQVQKESNLNSSKFPTQVHQPSKSGSSNLSSQVQKENNLNSSKVPTQVHQQSKSGLSNLPIQVLQQRNLDSPKLPTQSHQSSNLNSSKLPIQIHQQSNLDSAKLNQASTISHVRTTSTASANSIPIKLIEAPSFQHSKPGSITVLGKIYVPKLEIAKSTAEKSNVECQKPNVLPRSVSSTPVIQSKKTNPDSNQTADKKPSHVVSPVLSQQTSSTPKAPSFSTKRTLAPSNSTKDHIKNEYIEKGTSLTYVIPEDIKDLIKKDIVPTVLMKPLSPSTYEDYFAALLFAEDFYHEIWDGFEVENVTLELHAAAIYTQSGKHKKLNKDDGKNEVFVAFKIDSIPERRPYLLSKDFVFVRPSGSRIEPFQGILYRVVKSNLVLVKFGEDFHSQHYSTCKYSVKFSFNRVCLKRAHQAIAAASDTLFRNFLFPYCMPKSRPILPQLWISNTLDKEQVSAVRQILSRQSPPPYIVEGPLSVKNIVLTKTGVVIREAVLQIFRTSPSCRILICAPSNSTCDVLMRGLKEIPESDIFRANAAFREWDEVPSDILPSCRYEGACFSCPSLRELQRYKVISSTFMSAFRLHNEGLKAGHFSHIFLVDASSATEPEIVVPLANLANEKTVVVITGKPGDHSMWVRSNIARKNGLTKSYFERLRESKLYDTLDPKFITQLED